MTYSPITNIVMTAALGGMFGLMLNWGDLRVAAMSAIFSAGIRTLILMVFHT